MSDSIPQDAAPLKLTYSQANKDHINAMRRIRRKGKSRAAERRRYELKRNYGLSIDEYEAMWNAQNGVCAICKRPETAIDPYNPDNTRRLSVDHDHTTGKVRGLLCQGCNATLGTYENNIPYFRSIVAYLGLL